MLSCHMTYGHQRPVKLGAQQPAVYLLTTTMSRHEQTGCLLSASHISGALHR